MKLYINILIVIGLYVGANSVAFANTQNGVNVYMTGSEHHGSDVYVAINPNPDGCTFNAVYFMDAAELNQVLSIAMSAKVSGQKVRVDYTQTGGIGTQCIGYSIYLQ